MELISVDRPYFFDAGLRFACTQCGACCTGAPGIVRVTADETEALAAHLGMEPAAFTAQYCRPIAGGLSLREESNGDCVLRQGPACRVYALRPRQCQTFPFWIGNLRSEEAWASVQNTCPGVGQGRIFHRDEILAMLSDG
jgi:uncharacterized protein